MENWQHTFDSRRESCKVNLAFIGSMETLEEHYFCMN